MKIPLSGGWEDNIAGFGIIRAPNLTPENKTVIGKLTDAQLARSIRHEVNLKLLMQGNDL